MTTPAESGICQLFVWELQIVSDMKKDNLSNENAHSYAPPVCEEFYVGLEIVICASETENVGETEGEW